MGLFSGRKKRAAKQAEEEEQRRQKQLEDEKKAREIRELREKEIQERKEREVKEERSKKRQTQDEIMGEVTSKKKQIDQITNAIKTFETRCANEQKMGREAQKKGLKREALRHAQTVKRLKQRMAGYETQLKLYQDQLFALEDQGQNIQYVDQIAGTNATLKKINEQVNPDKVDNVLQDARDAVEATQAVQQTIQADSNLYGNDIDEDDLLNELNDDLGIEDNDPTISIPDVPNKTPIPQTDDIQLSNQMKNVSMSSTGKTQKEIEDEELRELEADLS